MAQIVAFLKIIQDGILPDHKKESISTTNILFRLHTKYLSTTFLITGTLLYIQQLFIEHLKCFRPAPEGHVLESAVLNQYCYTTGTYSLRNIDNFGQSEKEESQKESAYYFHMYFQWVPFILLLQGMACHVPQLIWNKFVENGRMAAFCKKAADFDEALASKENVPLTSSNVNSADPDIQIVAESKGTQADLIPPTADYPELAENSFANSLKSMKNRNYYLAFLLLEILNTVIIFINFITTDWFIQGNFFAYGPQWVHYIDKLRGQTMVRQSTVSDPEVDNEYLNSYLQRTEGKNPLEIAFPTLFNCRFEKPFSNGTTVYSINCIMSLNSIHQKIYLVFWFFFVLLFIMGVLNLIYRGVLFCSPTLRRSLVNKQAVKKSIRDREKLKNVLMELEVYDWFILDRILNNVDPQRFYSIMQEVSRAVEAKGASRGKGEGGERLSKNIVGIELEAIVAKE